MRLVAAFVTLLVLAPPVLAGPQDDLAKVLVEAKATPEPALAFFGKLASLPDGRFSQDDVRAAARTALVSKDEPLGKIVLGITTIEKRGNHVELRRADTAPITLGEDQGYLWLAAKASLDAEKDGEAVTVDGFDGVKLSERKDSMKGNLKKLRFEKDKKSKRRVVRLTAGLGPFSETHTIDLEPVAASATRGLTRSVDPQSP